MYSYLIRKNVRIHLRCRVYLRNYGGSTTSIDECDVVVPRNKIAEYVGYVNALEKQYGIRIGPSVMQVTTTFMYTCAKMIWRRVWKNKCSSIMENLYDKAISLNGQVTGEHG